MYYPFQINEQVRIYDSQNRNNIKAKIIELPSEENQLYLIEYVDTNDFGLTGQQRVIPSDIQKEGI